MRKSDKSRSVSNEIEHETSREVSVIDIPEDLTPFLLANVSQSGERCIYRVHKSLRDINPAAYTPKMVSIGPLHHGNKELVSMEKHKLIYLAEFCQRTGKTWTELAERIRTQKKRICACYESEIFEAIFRPPGPADDMVHMILLDSVFTIEFFLRRFEYRLKKNSHERDFLVVIPYLSLTVSLDLIKVENQLPFFVLDDLYSFAHGNRDSFLKSFYTLTCFNLERFICPPYVENENIPRHICARFFCLSCYKKQQPQEEVQHDRRALFNKFIALFEGEEHRHFTDLVRRCQSYNHPKPKNEKRVDILYNATKLHEAGVKFKVSPNAWPLNVKFERGTLTMPRFVLKDTTESIIRNLMAFEQSHYPHQAYICNYFILLDNLIDSGNDVDLFVKKGIISHGLGHNEAVAKLLNNICLEIIHTQWCYSDIASDLNAHYDNCWNKTMAKLRNVYFSDLWRTTGTVAATVLLILTFIQTIKAFK